MFFQTQFCSCVWDINSSVRCVYLLLPCELFSWGGEGEGEAEVKRIALDFQYWRAADTMSMWLGCTMEKVSWCTSITTVNRRTRRRLAMPAWWTCSPLLTPPWPRWLARGFSPKTGFFKIHWSRFICIHLQSSSIITTSPRDLPNPIRPLIVPRCYIRFWRVMLT